MGPVCRVPSKMLMWCDGASCLLGRLSDRLPQTQRTLWDYIMKEAEVALPYLEVDVCYCTCYILHTKRLILVAK